MQFASVFFCVFAPSHPEWEPFGECKLNDITVAGTLSQAKPPSMREGDRLQWAVEGVTLQLNARPVEYPNKI